MSEWKETITWLCNYGAGFQGTIDRTVAGDGSTHWYEYRWRLTRDTGWFVSDIGEHSYLTVEEAQAACDAAAEKEASK